ncbi:MAG: STAS domain-containing protein [Oscillospiraceae bacterium]|nr:STAS domain-containing protein [Oscillospiraceae bacterium]
MLNISKTIDEGKALFVLEGRLDTETSPDLDKEVLECPENVTELRMDFEKLDYISSAGLRVLLTAQKIMRNRGSFIVCNVNEIVMEIFEVTGFSDILTIE